MWFSTKGENRVLRVAFINLSDEGYSLMSRLKGSNLQEFGVPGGVKAEG